MANIIAVIWDCDKTLIDGYMQDPIFEDYEIDAVEFWKEVNSIPNKIKNEGLRVNTDTYYLNHFINYAKDGKFKGLNNAKLKSYGMRQKYYNGALELLEKIQNMFKDKSKYSEFGIQVENYVVSTGFAQVIRGSALNDKVEGIWGCELGESADSDGEMVISEVLYTIDNTTKTRAIFEINKGKDIDVNSSIPREFRRVRFENMIYIADGPSDIPAFSLIHQNNGATFAVYPHGDMKALKQVEEMREAGRVDMYAEADYGDDTTASMWIINKIQEIADRIHEEEKNKILNSTSGIPKHLTM